ncbi:RanGTP-binding protein-domain-containing protein [Hyaloraphidium curvatum]|nr:RanGTP-binding protein-domain-containing protein [Hyaloraphidium curvatum]
MESFDAMMAALPVEMIAVASKSAFGALVSFGVGRLAAYSASLASSRNASGDAQAGPSRGSSRPNSSDSRSTPSKNAPADSDPRIRDFNRLQTRLAVTLNSIAPAAGLLEIAAARGNTLLGPVVSMIRRTRDEVEALAARADAALAADSASREGSDELDEVLDMIPPLLADLDALVPLLQLNIAASGLSISAGVPQGVSLSRTLKASRDLVAASDAPEGEWKRAARYECAMYVLFEAHARPTAPSGTPGPVSKPWTWQEKFPRCEVSLWRRWRRPSGEPAIDFGVRIVEDRDDGRAHEGPHGKVGFDTDVPEPGEAMELPLSDLQKLHLATSSALLNLDEEKGDPVLLAKFDSLGGGANGAGKSTWVALGEYRGAEDSEDSSSGSSSDDEEPTHEHRAAPPPGLVPGASLSQLEHLLRLAQLETVEGIPHADAPDEVLHMYLEGTSRPADEGDAAPVHTPARSAPGTPGFRSPGTPGFRSSVGTPASARNESPVARRTKTLTKMATAGAANKGKGN